MIIKTIDNSELRDKCAVTLKNTVEKKSHKSGSLKLFAGGFRFFEDNKCGPGLSEYYSGKHKPLTLTEHDHCGNLVIESASKGYNFEFDLQDSLRKEIHEIIETAETLWEINREYSMPLLEQCLDAGAPVPHPFFRKHVKNRNSAKQLLNELQVFSSLRNTIYGNLPWFGVNVKITIDTEFTKIKISDMEYIETEDSITYKWVKSEGGFFDDSWRDTPYCSQIRYIAPENVAAEQNVHKNPFGLEGCFTYTAAEQFR